MVHYKVKSYDYSTKVLVFYRHPYDAIDRQVTLDIEYPILYNQVVKFYEEKGVDFYGDVDEDYDILLD